MKKTAILCVIFISVIGLTSCTNTNVDGAAKTTIEMELDENYDDTEPFINEKLFCVSEDLDNLVATGNFEMVGEKGTLEIKDNKTNEVLWSDAWEGTVKSETLSISLDNLKTGNEYVVCFTGSKIEHAAVEVIFDSDFVQEKEKPSR